MKKSISIRKMLASIKIVDERNIEMNFLSTNDACNAIAIMLKTAIMEQIELLGNVHEKFQVEMTIIPKA